MDASGRGRAGDIEAPVGTRVEVTARVEHASDGGSRVRDEEIGVGHLGLDRPVEGVEVGNRQLTEVEGHEHRALQYDRGATPQPTISIELPVVPSLSDVAAHAAGG